MALLVLAGAAVIIFVGGNLYRVVRIARMPMHLRWELYPLPRGSRAQQRYGGSYFEESAWWGQKPRRSWHSELAYVAREVLGFATLRQHNRSLWLWSWLMHTGFYALILTAGLTMLGASLPAVRVTASLAAGGGILGSAGLLVARSTRLRPYSSRADFFNLLLIAAIFLSAAAVVWDAQASGQMVAFAAGLFLATAIPVATAAAVHIVLLSAFLLYFPATHMTHAYMKFFSFHRVRWDDAALRQRPEMARAMAANLARPISWAAPHIGAGATWAEATRCTPEDRR